VESGSYLTVNQFETTEQLNILYPIDYEFGHQLHIRTYINYIQVGDYFLMPAHVLILGIGVFLGALFIQILVWNVFEILRPIKILALIFIILPVVVFILLIALNYVNWVEVIAALLLHLFLSSAYIQSYPLFQEDIPSFRIVLYIRDYEYRSLTTQKIVNQLATDDLFSNKLQNLIDDGLVAREGKELFLTRLGHLLVWCFSRYRSWLGLDIGRG